MDRNRLAHAQGDAINPILAAAGYNFRLILKWIRLLLSLLWIASSPNYQTHSSVLIMIVSLFVFRRRD